MPSPFETLVVEPYATWALDGAAVAEIKAALAAGEFQHAHHLAEMWHGLTRALITYRAAVAARENRPHERTDTETPHS
jgi:hypothetical protein